MFPARDRYEAGQTVTMIGYGTVADPAWREHGPYYAYLRVDPLAAELDARTARPDDPALVHHTDVRLGEVVVEDAPADAVVPVYSGQLPHRVSVTFPLPESLPPRAYEVRLCNDPCTAALDYFWPEVVNVGVDPTYPIVRDWPLTEPAIRWLEDDALLMGPDLHPLTAADVRAGRVPAPPPPPPPPDPLPLVTASPVTGADPARAAGPPGPTGTAEPPANDGSAQTEAASHGKATAWWVAGEAALLVLGGAALLRWTGRRRRGRPVLVDTATTDDPRTGHPWADCDALGTEPDLHIESTHSRAPTERAAGATPSAKDMRDSAPAGGVRHALRVRL